MQSLIIRLDTVLRKTTWIPSWIKLPRRLLFYALNSFFKPFYLRVFRKKIDEVPKSYQLFFVGRNDFGTQLYLLSYAKLWSESRGPVAIVILTSDFHRVVQLASLLVPQAMLIYPDTFQTLLPMTLFGTKIIHYLTFSYVYPFLANDRPDGLNLFYLFGNGITEYNEFLDRHYQKYKSEFSPSFLNAYKAVRSQFDYKWHLFEDYYAQYKKRELVKPAVQNSLLTLLNIKTPYVVLNVNCKKYLKYSNRRRVQFPERYNVLIDRLIEKGYQVVVQGREEQPYFTPRNGLIDYSRSSHTSVVNDMTLFTHAEFAITSKSGIEIFATLTDTPVMGVNYTELLGMQPAKKMRYFPKYIRDNEKDRLFSWKDHLNSPAFFEIGENLYEKKCIEYIEMSEDDLNTSLEEFLLLLKHNEWNTLTTLQQEFMSTLTPLHLELAIASAVPSAHYLELTNT